MFILSIETSCDETSIAILSDRKVLSNITLSQIDEHKIYGGVVPGLASRLHVKNIQKVLRSCLDKSGISSLDKIDLVCYTESPGMAICLQIGKILAYTISSYFKKPILPCNHLHGHIFSSLIDRNEDLKFPSLSLVISGGHTQLYLLEDYDKIKMLGETLDDALGEFLDKSALVMGYKYPGGPKIEAKAKEKIFPKIINLPFPLNDKTFNFSFSGLKTKVFDLIKRKNRFDEFFDYSDLSYSIQLIAAKILVKKIANALIFFENLKINCLLVGGGVICNSFLRDYIKKKLIEIIKKRRIHMISFFFPKKKYSTDNAAMIGLNAYFLIKNKNKIT